MFLWLELEWDWGGKVWIFLVQSEPRRTLQSIYIMLTLVTLRLGKIRRRNTFSRTEPTSDKIHSLATFEGTMRGTQNNGGFDESQLQGEILLLVVDSPILSVRAWPQAPLLRSRDLRIQAPVHPTVEQRYSYQSVLCNETHPPCILQCILLRLIRDGTGVLAMVTVWTGSCK